MAAIAIGASTASAQTSAPAVPATAEGITLTKLELDGFQYVPRKRRDPSGQYYWQNGAIGEGLMLSAYAELSTPVLRVEDLNANKVILADGSALTPRAISKTISAFKFRLGSAHRSLGFQIELLTPGRKASELMKFKELAGVIEVARAIGTVDTTSGLLQDAKNSAEDKLGIQVEQAMQLGKRRYYVLKIKDAHEILNVAMLDEQGKPLKQTEPFGFGGKTTLKLYVDKPEGTPFVIRLTRPERIEIQSIPFEFKDFDLLDL